MSLVEHLAANDSELCDLNQLTHEANALAVRVDKALLARRVTPTEAGPSSHWTASAWVLARDHELRKAK